MFRIFLELRSAARGLRIKLAGKIRANPASGRLETTFEDNPQLPVERIALRFKGGPRAPLTTPPTCGTHTATARLTSWAGQERQLSDAFAIDCTPGLGGFAPAFAAGTTNPVGGAFSPFVLRFGREDGQRELGAVNASLPPGLAAILASVPLCAAERAGAGTCGAESRIGSVTTEAGPGATPFTVRGDAYLTRPLRPGDVAGLSVVVPAKAGPYDLGVVVVRAFLSVRAKDQGIDVASEPLPRIMGGVPLRIRQVEVAVDRRDFMFNPSSCRAMAIGGNVFSQQWAKVPVLQRFQVAGCTALPLAPVVAVRGGGARETARFRHPALQVTLRQRTGEARLAKANVVLPRAFNVDLKSPPLKAACARDVYARDRCPAAATVGTVKAVTPVFAEPLTGPVFLLRKKGQLPDLVMRLRNSQHALDLIGVLDFLRDGRIITRVGFVPDIPIRSFELRIAGGSKGSLLNRSDLCALRAATQATFKGQNGKVVRRAPATRIDGCRPAKLRASGGRS
jgi:hypothetical protein